jgi:5-carboxymethyl-2-hydroxymuconate isomerase
LREEGRKLIHIKMKIDAGRKTDAGVEVGSDVYQVIGCIVKDEKIIPRAHTSTSGEPK